MLLEKQKKIALNKRILKSKTTWSIVNELLGRKHYTQGIQEINVEGKPITTQQEIVNELHSYFTTIIDKINYDNQGNVRHGTDNYCYLNKKKKTSYPPLVFKTFSTREILMAIRSFQNKNSFGYDEISTKLLKISAK
jgi:hypothetical protein